MFEILQIQPKRYPTNLINKDWLKRPITYRADYLELLNRIHELEVFEDDVWLVTVPKCGTTWMHELLWLIMNDIDFETAKSEHLEVRAPFMEFNYMLNEDIEIALKPLENLPRPRLIKTHLCLPLLPAQIWDKKPKVVYVARNIKDALVSKYFYNRSFGIAMDKTVDQYINDEMEGKNFDLHVDPFLHITEFYELRHEPWLYYTSFERMKSNLREVITQLCKFLNKTITNEIMEKLLKHLSFEEMKNNTKANLSWGDDQIRKKFGLPHDPRNFHRKGQVNGYKDELSPEMVAKLEKWVDKNFAKYNVTMDELL